jgi:hypothetical protein
MQPARQLCGIKTIIIIKPELDGTCVRRTTPARGNWSSAAHL